MKLLTYPIRFFDRLGEYYLFLICSGIGGLVWQPTSLKTAGLIALPFYVTMASLIIGGALCSFGRWKHLPTPKMFGLALILVSMVTYVLALLSRWPQSAVTVFFLLSFISLLGRQLGRVRKSRDALLAVRNGTADRSDLASYASDSLARRRRDPGSSLRSAEVFRRPPEASRGASAC